MRFFRFAVWMSCLLAGGLSWTQEPVLSSLQVGRDSPLYTTYCAAMERSQSAPDHGYRLVFHEPSAAVEFQNQHAGDSGLAWKQGAHWVHRVENYHLPPTITVSYPDVVKYVCQPFAGVEAEATFFVYSSRMSIYEIKLTNSGNTPVQGQLWPLLHSNGRAFDKLQFLPDSQMLLFRHQEPARATTGEVALQNVWMMSARPERLLSMADDMSSATAALHTDGPLPTVVDGIKSLAVCLSYSLDPQQSQRWRLVRVAAAQEEDIGRMIADGQNLMRSNVQIFVKANEDMYRRVPRLGCADKSLELVYYSAVNMMWQRVLPPEGKCRTTYHVVSREPALAAAQQGQSLYESLAMHAYAAVDPLSAMNCLRIYRDRQAESGYLFYRLGPYLDDNALGQEQPTTALPCYAWLNWEIYKIAKDKKFLQEMYLSAKMFYNYMIARRDSDKDGLCEWHGQPAKESGRDGRSVVWDEVGAGNEVEALDLNCMLANEAEALAAMANELGLTDEANAWLEAARQRRQKINELFWDEANGFYFHIDRNNHSFTLKKTDDLKREEIIGLLPLWAGVATPERAQRLVAKLRDANKFWRRYGIPSLAADDRSYDDKGHWNGPVWVPWNCLVVSGLMRYGYTAEAREVSGKVVAAVATQLRRNHDFWECYSPDTEWAGHHRSCLWSGMVNRLLLDFAEKDVDK